MPTDPVLAARSRVARAHRRLGGNPEQIDAARQELTDAKFDRAVNQAISAAPPLSVEARERIAALLLTGGGS